MAIKSTIIFHIYINLPKFAFPPVSNIPVEISRVITQLIMRIEKLESENVAYVKIITVLEAVNAALTSKVAELEEELLLSKNGLLLPKLRAHS